MANFRHVVDAAYQELLKRPADPEELDTSNTLLNNGLTEAQLREGLLRSDEYKQRFPDEPDEGAGTQPGGPAPPCPEESKRGWSILYVNRDGRRLFTGNTACEKAAREGKLRPGDNLVLDSTALVGTQDPVPEGCGTCDERPTKWSHTMGGRSRIDGNCGFEIWPEHTGTVTACDPDGQKCVTKQIRIGP